MDEFKAMLKKKANGRIKEEKPLAATPRSDREGGKLMYPFSHEK
jgi:hypothetical protein